MEENPNVWNIPLVRCNGIKKAKKYIWINKLRDIIKKRSGLHQGNRKLPTFACDAFCSGMAVCDGEGSVFQPQPHQSKGESCPKKI